VLLRCLLFSYTAEVAHWRGFGFPQVPLAPDVNEAHSDFKGFGLYCPFQGIIFNEAAVRSELNVSAHGIGLIEVVWAPRLRKRG
jgi:hypothetical protein